MNKVRKLIVIVLCFVITASCEKANVLTEYSNTDSDEALYLDAKNKIDDSDWDSAIDILTNQLSTSYQARNDVRTTLMYAYGGKCGISFFDMINALKSATSTKIFELALRLFSGKNVNVAACDNAVNVLMSLGTTAAERTRDQNLFAAILGLSRMAATLHSKFDTEFSGLGDGSVDAGADSCAIASTAGRLSDAEMNKIVTGVGLIFENLAVIGEELTSGTAGSTFDDAKALCETTFPLPAIGVPHDWDNSLPPATTWTDVGLSTNTPTWVDLGLPADVADPINCLNTQDSAVPDKMRRIFRRMISSSTMGVGSCDISNMNLVVDTSSSPLAHVSANCCPGLAAP